MKRVTRSDPRALAREAAAFIATEARSAIRIRGHFLLALSGGATPTAMLDQLAVEEVAWSSVHVFQVDERITDASNPARNLLLLKAHLLDKIPIPMEQVHPMPVEAPDLPSAARDYAKGLAQLAGYPPILDLVHLGLGEDGHTASLIPGDPVLEVLKSDVALTGSYRGFRRMTLTFPVLARARCILWLVTGPNKTQILNRLDRGDRSIPAGRLPAEHAILYTDANLS